MKTLWHWLKKFTKYCFVAFLLLRRYGVPLGIAGPGALLVLASPPMQGAILTIRGDLLTTAFNVCGLAVALPAGKRPSAMMMSLHVWSMSHGIASLFGRGDSGRRSLPMSAEELLESEILIYLQGLGFPQK